MDDYKTNMVNIGWDFDNTYAELPDYFYTITAPQRAPSPELVVFNTPLSQELGLRPGTLKAPLKTEELAQFFSGNVLPQTAKPIALAYAGHQFGYFTLLGDGRAHLIGEHRTPQGKRFDVQLKGSGKTVYGRRGDGKATLGPMLREYILSEAMHALGVPTTRSLAVVLTGEQVLRERPLPGAVLTRIAASHLRVGTFEYIATKHDVEALRVLADYTLTRHCPEALEADAMDPYLYLLQWAIKKQVDLMVQWMRVGFIHGVMNTDNMALSGETLDYGPCAFMDTYDPATVFSSIDQQGRYAYTNQPTMAQWGLARFAETLLPLLHTDQEKALELAEEALQGFGAMYESQWLTMMGAKIGLSEINEQSKAQDKALILELLNCMQLQNADFTNTFRALIEQVSGNRISPGDASIMSLFECPPFQAWQERWIQRLKQNNPALISAPALMRANNPCVIPRNHKVNQALDAALAKDYAPLLKLLAVLAHPYAENAESTAYQLPPTPDERVCQTFCGT